MNKVRPLLAVFTGISLLLMACDGSREPALGETAKPIGTTYGAEKNETVSIKEVALNNGILYLMSNPGPYSGLVNSKWPNNNKKYQCTYTDGLKNGPELAWHENGERKMAKQFKAGVQEGQTQEWWNNGQMKSITTYMDGKAHGEAKGWHDNGKLARIIIFEKGIPVGKSEGWWENGAHAEVINYVNGKPDGYSIKWHKNSKTNRITFNRNGFRQGTETTWYQTGRKKMQLNFVNGKPSGDVLEWYPDGKQLSVMKYAKGVEQGPGVGWHVNGNVKWSGNWSDGRLHGLFTTFYSNGIKRLETEYNSGILRRKSKFDIRGQLTENTIIPPGRTIHWTETKLMGIRATKSQIQKSFGRPEKVNGEIWIFSGIHLVRKGKTQKVTVAIQFDTTGTSSNVSVQ